MALAPWMMGLLGQDESLAPNLGLLGTATGGDPIKAALAQLAVKPPTPQMSQTERRAPRLAQAPGAVPGAPPIRPPRRAQMPNDPEISPVRAGIVAGGAALAQTPAIYGSAAAIGRALEAGLPAFIATKNQRDQARIAAGKEQDFRDLINDPETQGYFKKNPTALKLFQSMGAATGMPALQKYIEERSKPEKLGKDETLVDKDGNVIAKGRESRQIERGPNGELIEVPGEADKPLVKLTGDKTEPLSPEAETLSQMTFGKGVKDLTPEQGARLNELWKQLKHAGSTNVSVGGPKMDDPIPEGLDEERKGATFALETMGKASEALRLLGEGITTGTFAPTRLALGNAMATIGAISPESRDKVAATQQYLATTAQTILTEVGRLGGGLRGLTEKEREWMTQAMAGNLKDQPEALLGVLNSLQKASYLLAERYQERQAKILGDNPSAARREYYKIDLPDPPPSVLWARMTAKEREAVVKAGGKAP